LVEVLVSITTLHSHFIELLICYWMWEMSCVRIAYG